MCICRNELLGETFAAEHFRSCQPDREACGDNAYLRRRLSAARGGRPGCGGRAKSRCDYLLLRYVWLAWPYYSRAQRLDKESTPWVETKRRRSGPLYPRGLIMTTIRCCSGVRSTTSLRGCSDAQGHPRKNQTPTAEVRHKVYRPSLASRNATASAIAPKNAKMVANVGYSSRTAAIAVNRLPTPVKISASPRFSSIGCRLTSMAPWQSPTAIACDCVRKQK